MLLPKPSPVGILNVFFHYHSIPLNVASQQEAHTLGEEDNVLMPMEIHGLIVNCVLEAAGFKKQWNDWSKNQLWCQLKLSILKGWSVILEVRLVSTRVWYMVQALAETVEPGTKVRNGNATSHNYISYYTYDFG